MIAHSSLRFHALVIHRRHFGLLHRLCPPESVSIPLGMLSNSAVCRLELGQLPVANKPQSVKNGRSSRSRVPLTQRPNGDYQQSRHARPREPVSEAGVNRPRSFGGNLRHERVVRGPKMIHRCQLSALISLPEQLRKVGVEADHGTQPSVRRIEAAEFAVAQYLQLVLDAGYGM